MGKKKKQAELIDGDDLGAGSDAEKGGKHKDKRADDYRKEYRKVHLNPIKFYLLNNKMRALYGLTLCLVVAGLIPLGVNTFWPVMRPVTISPGLCVLQNTFRIECIPGQSSVSFDTCFEKDCCFRDDGTGGIFVPTCYHSFPSKYVYIVTSVAQNSDNSTRQYNLQSRDKLAVTPMGSPSSSKAQARMEKNPRGMNGTVQITLNASPRSSQHGEQFMGDATTTSSSEIDVDIWETDIHEPGNYFFLQMDRNSTGERIMDASIGALIISPQFCELTLKLSSNRLVGFSGEEGYRLAVDFDYHSAVIYNRPDSGDAMTHIAVPFYIMMEESGAAHGVYFDTQAPMEVKFLPTPAITVRVLDGSISWFIFEGPTPADVMRQFAQVTGKPRLPPYWAFGYHMCRETSNITDFYTVHANMVRNESTGIIPYDSDCISSRLFGSTPYVFNDADFEPDEVGNIKNMLKNESRRLIGIQTPHVLAQGEAGGKPYYPYEEGLQLGVFLRNSSISNDAYVGLYNGAAGSHPVAYPDFHAPNAQTWLRSLFENITSSVDFDAYMLEDNSPVDDSPYVPPPPEAAPYFPAFGGGRPMLYDSLPWTVMSASAGPSEVNHWQNHNGYGASHLKSVVTVLETMKPKERPFVVSETSDAFGSKVGGFTGGDYSADWFALKKSLIHVLKAGILGQPFTGTFICGNLDPKELNVSLPDAFEDLCLRWHQLGLSFPLAFNHYAEGAIPRNPTDLHKKQFQLFLRIAMRQRYRLLPYFYSLAIEAARENMPIARPMFFEFPDDKEAFGRDDQFMIGPSVLVAPSLRVGETTVEVYFPKGTWMDFYNGNVLYSDKNNGSSVSIPVSGYQSPIALRAGHIVLWQVPGETTTESRKNPFWFSAAIDTGRGAQGRLYFDDGETPVGDPETHPFRAVHSYVDPHEKSFTLELVGPACDDAIARTLNTVVDGGEIFNLASHLTKVTEASTGVELEFYYSAATKSVEITNITGIATLDFCKEPIVFFLSYD